MYGSRFFTSAKSDVGSWPGQPSDSASTVPWLTANKQRVSRSWAGKLSVPYGLPRVIRYGSDAHGRPPTVARRYAAPNVGATLAPTLVSSSHHSCIGRSNRRLSRVGMARGEYRKCPYRPAFTVHDISTASGFSFLIRCWSRR